MQPLFSKLAEMHKKALCEFANVAYWLLTNVIRDFLHTKQSIADYIWEAKNSTPLDNHPL